MSGTRVLVVAVVSLVAALGAASGAQAACNSAIDDGHGAVWAPDGHGRVNVSVTTGATTRTNAYDTFGTLYVDGTAYDAGADSCTDVINVSSGITARRYPNETIDGLTVHRVLSFRSLSSGSEQVHAMIQTVVVKAAAAKSGATVAIGEDSSSNVDDLGSDSATTVVGTDDGDLDVEPANDDWAITSDHASGALTDPAIFHGWGSSYTGQQRPAVVGPSSASGADHDNWRTRWSSVSIAAGATATFTTVEAVLLPADLTVGTAETALSNNAYYLDGPQVAFSAPAPALTLNEILASRNVAVPAPTVSVPVPTRAATGEPVQVVRAYNDPGVSQCGAVTATVKIDGNPVDLPSNGRTTVTLPAGAHPGVATATNSCGTATQSATTTVADGRTTCSHTFSAGDGLPLFDSTGAGYDPFSNGALYDGGNAALNIGDSYDVADGLSVGGINYSPAIPADGCALEASGRLIRQPEQTLGGLQVSRTTWVPSGGPGARLGVIVRNTGSSPVTVPVEVGASGNLGSDAGTREVASGNGVLPVQPSARWLVTDDATDGGGDPALAHVWDGAGGADQADTVKPVTEGDDGYDVAFKDVTVQPGQTVTYLLWEAQRFRNPRAVGEDDDAVAAAKAIAGLSGDALYGGMTAADIRSVRNWAHPQPAGTISGPSTGVAGTAQSFTIAGLAGGKDTPACGAGSVAWTVDGVSAGTSTSISPTLAAGTHTLTATISGDCGSDPVLRTQSYTATAPVGRAGTGASAQSGSSGTPVATLKLGALKLSGGCVRASKRKATLKASATASQAGTVTLTIAKLGGRVKSCVSPTSKAGRKLLARKPGKALVAVGAKVAKAKASFSVPLTLTRKGKAKVKKGRLTLPRGVYLVRVSSGTAASTGLLVVL